MSLSLVSRSATVNPGRSLRTGGRYRRTLPEAAAARGWSRDRAVAALDAIGNHPAIADPLVLRAIAPQTYTLTTRPDRSSPKQRAALKQ